MEHKRSLIGISDEGAYWSDLGTPESLLLGAEYMRNSAEPLIHESVVMAFNVDISNSEIGAKTIINSDSIISNSLILDSVTIGPNAQIYNSIIANNAIIEENARISGAVIGPYVRVSAEFYTNDRVIKLKKENQR